MAGGDQSFLDILGIAVYSENVAGVREGFQCGLQKGTATARRFNDRSRREASTRNGCANLAGETQRRLEVTELSLVFLLVCHQLFQPEYASQRSCVVDSTLEMVKYPIRLFAQHETIDRLSTNPFLSLSVVVFCVPAY